MSRTLIKEGLKALREQGSLMDFVNRVAPPGGKVRDTIGNISNRVTGGNSSTSTQQKKPGYKTLNDLLNRRGGYTSKNKMFYYDDHGDVSYGEMTGGIGPTIYYGSKGGSAYGGNDRKDGRGIAILDDSPYERGITTREFGRGGEFKTITGTGRSREGDAAKEVKRRALGEQDFSDIFDLINYSGKQRTVPTTKELSASLARSGRQAKPIGTTTYQGFTVPVGPDVGVYQERQPGGPQPMSIQPGYLDAVERYNQMANKPLATRKPSGDGGGGGF